jgi:hypothetical protein
MLEAYQSVQDSKYQEDRQKVWGNLADKCSLSHMVWGKFRLQHRNSQLDIPNILICCLHLLYFYKFLLDKGSVE